MKGIMVEESGGTEGECGDRLPRKSSISLVGLAVNSSPQVAVTAKVGAGQASDAAGRSLIFQLQSGVSARLRCAFVCFGCVAPLHGLHIWPYPQKPKAARLESYLPSQDFERRPASLLEPPAEQSSGPRRRHALAAALLALAEALLRQPAPPAVGVENLADHV